MSYITLPACKKTDRRLFPKCSRYITKYNPKGLNRFQLGLSPKEFKQFWKKGIKPERGINGY